MNGNIIVKRNGRRYVYHCTKRSKVEAYRTGRKLRLKNNKIYYTVIKGRNYGWNLYVSKNA